jgi:lycopene beta-cyclase
MTNYKFNTHQNNIIQVGTIGGQTKGSTGYTFNFIQKHSKEIVKLLIEDKKPVVNYKGRFQLYDSILLGILNKKSYSGQLIFEKLFTQNNIQSVLKFLDNETTLKEELKIILTLPFKPFLNSALHYLL